MKEFVVLGLGSNRGWGGLAPLQLLRAACKKLSHLLSDFSYSAVYLTKPMYVENQEKFFNMVVSGFIEDTDPFELLDKIHQIEASLGRNRACEIRNGPRSIDIDIEIFGDRTIYSETLEIPHPRIKERAFVLVPLLEVLEKNADSERYEGFFSDFGKLNTDDIEKILRFEEL